MDWLMNNPLADMRGPRFLALYAVAITLTIIIRRVLTRQLDWTGNMAPPPIPSKPDPYEIAYLRGGVNEVTRSVVFALVQKGLLRMTPTGRDTVIEREPTPSERQQLSMIERRALDWFAGPQKASDLFKASGLSERLKPFCAEHEQRLQNEKLLTTDDTRQTARLTTLAAASGIVGLGAYKLIVAIAEGRYNVGFLILMAVVGIIVLVKVSGVPRVSRRGRAYLERLQTAFQLSKRQAMAAPALAADGANYATAHAFDPSLVLLVGVFGVGALAGTPFDYYQQSFQRASLAGNGPASSGSGCGSSCGSSDNSSSSSSDGGSSCSSGSSCGGGCGGGGCGG